MTFLPGNSSGGISTPQMTPGNLPGKKELDMGDTALTVDLLKATMPKRMKANITPRLVAEINALVTDPEARDNFRENLVGFSSVMNDPNMKMTNYIFAVKYVSYKLMGDNNEQAWCKTFPDRHARLLRDKKDANFLRSTVSCYHRTKLVQMLMEQSLIKPYVYNQDLYQEALNTQASLMRTASSEKVRTEAANSLLVNLRQPDNSKLQIDLTVKEDDSIRELREATYALAAQQRLAIEAGAITAKELAESRLINGESRRIDG